MKISSREMRETVVRSSVLMPARQSEYVWWSEYTEVLNTKHVFGEGFHEKSEMS
jgi:hypothetical protein